MPPNETDPDAVFARILTEAGRRGRLRRMWPLAAVATVVVVAIAVPVVAANRSPRRTLVATANDATSSSSTVSTSTSTPTTSSSTPETTVPTASTAVTASTTATTGPPAAAEPSGCRNSSDPACGPFYWDPQPANAPLLVEVSVAPPVGKTVTITVHASDADAEIWDCPTPGQHFTVTGDTLRVGCSHTMECRIGPPRFGAWDPPPATPSDVVWTYTATFAMSGTKTIDVAPESFSDYDLFKRCDGVTDPYVSNASKTLEVTIAPS